VFRVSARGLFIVLLVVVVAGCGFHLRGAVSVPPVMQRTLITGTDNSPLYYELESALTAAGARVVEGAESATATLVIERERYGRRVLSVDSLGRASEYELSLHIVFSLRGQDGRVIADKEALSVLRDYSFDPDNVLGSSGQEMTLQTEMRRYAARQILRRLQSLARTVEGQVKPAVSAPAQ